MEILTANGIEVLLRWIHVLAGITWIGVLYYLNFIQTPLSPRCAPSSAAPPRAP